MTGKIFSVSDINGYIHRMFDQDMLLEAVNVEGEISNCKYDQRGHLYFSLKDENAAISCVMYKSSQSRGLKCSIGNGKKCVVSGNVSVYEKNGTFQIYARQIKGSGLGNLFEKFELLKNKLKLEGLFDQDHKKPLKPYAKKIGVVTASTGAVIHDILNVQKRRNPFVQIVLYPSRVQGDGAALDIAEGIRFLDGLELDCIIVGRGGGSMEDLWAFNEECVVRAVYECETPVISAVGHETDITLCDFAADRRAPTPSAACELAVFDVYKALESLHETEDRFEHVMSERIRAARLRTDSLKNRLKSNHPHSKLMVRRQLLDNYKTRLTVSFDKKMSAAAGLVDKRRILQKGYSDRLVMKMNSVMKDYQQRLELLKSIAQQKSPVNKLSGGFVYASDKDGHPISSLAQVELSDIISLRAADGFLKAQVIEKQHQYIKKE